MKDALAALLQELTRLEAELHTDGTRRDKGRLNRLLHPDFVEFGRSGTRYNRDDMLKALTGEEASANIDAHRYELAQMGDGVALLTYASAHVDTNGNRQRHALRSSLWVRTDAGWQIMFHQATPTTATVFDVGNVKR